MYKSNTNNDSFNLKNSQTSRNFLNTKLRKSEHVKLMKRLERDEYLEFLVV